MAPVWRLAAGLGRADPWCGCTRIVLAGSPVVTVCSHSITQGHRRVSHPLNTPRIDQGRITQAGHRTIALPASAAPNTRIVVPDVAVIMLNRQFTGARGTLTVQAMRIRLLDHHQKLILATSVCAAANLAPAPEPGGPALRLTLGGLGLLLLGSLAYLLSRRARGRAD